MEFSNKILGVFTSVLLISTIFSGISIKGDTQTSNERLFHDYESLTDELQDIALTYPAITNLYELGQSVQGRSIWGLKITDNPDIEENEVEIQFEGCHHGNEYMSVEMPLNLAWLLVENYSVDPTITDYVNNREIWIVPLVNPDGREMNQRRNANDVDLNRDYGYMHGGDSPAPFSQPETQVMREHGLNNNIKLAYSYHTTAEYVNYVWDYKPQDSPDEPWIDMISQIYADYSGYTKIQGFDWYPTTGASDDGNYGCFGNINTIIETFNSDVSFSWNRNRDAMLSMIDVADMGLSGVVTDAVTGDPINASVWVEEHNWPVFTDPVVGDYHKGLLEGTYHVHFIANGYDEQVKQITITDANASNILDAQLVPGSGYYGYQVTMCEYFIHTSNPSEGVWALGPPDNISASLGNGGMMVVDMGNHSPIIDGTDDDFTVYEGDDTPEGYTVSVSNTFNGPWSSLGSATGTQSFDISDIGLTEARFVRIDDDGISAVAKDYAGFDLDAIQADEIFNADHDILVSSLDVPSIIPHGEIQTVAAMVKNNGLYTETGITIDFLINETVLDSTIIPSLTSMESTEVSFSWDPAIGTYLVAVESQPIPDEYDLLNNHVNKTVDVIAAPAIEVTPLSLSFMMPTDTTDTDPISIANLVSAEAPLDYAISYAGDLGGSWLSALPASGSVAVDDADVVIITVDTTGLSEGDYNGEVIISSNDLDDPEVIVTVSLTVVFGNDMAVLSINNPVGVIPAGLYTVNATVQNKGFYPQTDVLVNCSIFEGGIGGVIIDEDFASDPTDWTITNVEGTAWTWDSSEERMEHSYSGSPSGYLDSPVLDCSGKLGVNLSFWHYWKADYSSGNQDGYVRGSIDGGLSFPFLIDEFHHNDPADETAVKYYDISSWANNQPQVMIRFDITNDNDWYWYVDDFNVSADITGSLAYTSENLVSLPAYESSYVEFTPEWNANLGVYTIQITTLLAGDENSGNDIILDVVSVEGPSLCFDPLDYNIGTILVNTTDSTSFEIWNCRVGVLSYSLSETCDWLTVAPLSGDSTGEHDMITVDIDTTDLPEGPYHCDISISSNAGAGVFTVDMNVISDTTPLEDVNQSMFDRGFPIRHTWDGDWGAAQNFTPSMSVIPQVDIYLRKFGTPEFDLTVELRENGPEGLLIDSLVFPAAEVPSSWTWLIVDFSDTVVNSGTDYFIVLPPAPSGVSTSFGYEWGYAFGDHYQPGSFWFTRDGGGLWRDLPTMYEFTFITYGLG